jgi:hypothetical protein
MTFWIELGLEVKGRQPKKNKYSVKESKKEADSKTTGLQETYPWFTLQEPQSKLLQQITKHVMFTP